MTCTNCGEPITLTDVGLVGIGGVCRNPFNPNQDDAEDHMTAVVCVTSGKHRYPSWDAAVRHALRRSKRCGLPLRIYRCECGGFHLTRRATWSERKAA